MKWLLVAAIATFSIPANAQVVDCTLTPTRGFTGVTPTKIRLDFESSLGRVIIKDDVGPKVGRRSITGDVRRYVGSEILFKWEIKSVPQALKPPTETNSYRSTVNYSGRFNPDTGAIKIVGNFVTSISSANTGLNMRAQGRCR